MILTFITTFAGGWTFVMGFNTVEFIYGDRIKAWLQGKKEEKRNSNLVKEFDKKINADIAKSMLPDEIELVHAEEVNHPRNKEPHSYSWEVSHSSQLGQRQVSTQLIIIENGNS